MNKKIDDQLLQEAYTTIEQLRERLAKNVRNENEVGDIAIIGVSCQLPGHIHSLETFWNILKDGRCVIDTICSQRWPTVRDEKHFGGLLTDPFAFDNTFFGISPIEARHLDPQHRLLLMRTEDALKSANINPSALFNSNTGVFIGIGNTDYYQRIALNPSEEIGAYIASGNSPSMASGRISHFYGLKGPSISIDTACSSSLVSLHHASMSIKQNECNYAIVGAVNLMLAPLIQENFSKAGMLAKDGYCKVFADDADGYVRSEGCVVLVLTSLQQAEKNNHPVLAVIKGSAINHDGHTLGLTTPNGPSQTQVIKHALVNAGVSIDDIDYLEAHGTGTSLGDPIEINALHHVFSARKQPLQVGSVKANIGHLEIAAGMASLLKAICLIHYRQIPPQIHCDTLNSKVNWKENCIRIATKLTPWPSSKNNCVIGISGFGFSGTNTHIIVAAPPRMQNTLPKDSTVFNLSHFEVPYHSKFKEQKAEKIPTLYSENWQLIEDVATISNFSFAELCAALSVPTELKDHYRHYIALMGLLEKKCQQIVSELSAETIIPKYKKLYQHAIMRLDTAMTQTVFSWEELLQHYPNFHQEINFLKTCLDALPDILRGKITATDLLFSGADAANAVKFYQARQAAYFDTQIAEIVLRYCHHFSKPTVPLRILEVGAGTGATTKHILPLLNNHQVIYYFTDISSYFLHSAQKTFNDYAFVQYDIVDISRPLPEKFATFDIIIAANVIHATPKITETLNHLLTKLASRGILIMRECTRPTLTADLTFGLNEGWWLFEGDPVRANYPLLSADHWQQHLKQVGFDGIHVCESEKDTYEHLFIAQPKQQLMQTVFITNATHLITKCSVNNERFEVLDWNKPINWHDWFASRDLNESHIDFIFCFDPAYATNDLAREWQQLFLAPVYCLQSINQLSFEKICRLSLLSLSHQKNKNFIGEGLSGALSGVARVIALEYPMIYRGWIRLPADEPCIHGKSTAIFNAYPNEQEFLYQQNRLTVRRLKLSQPSLNHPLSIDPHACYLITGASGGLGIETARWLVQCGVKHLVLLARNADVARLDNLILELQKKNVTITKIAADVADKPLLAKLFTRFGMDLLPLKGIFHTAGVGGDCKISEITSESLPEMAAAKVMGTYYLHLFSQTHRLDYFVVYSSVVATWGAKTRAHYASVNAFSIALMQERAQQGLPALVIDWGPWKNTGMINQDSEMQAEKIGLRPMLSESYFDSLQHALTSNSVHVIAASVDWQRFASSYSVFRNFHLVDDLLEQTKSSPMTEAKADPSAELKNLATLEQLKEIFARILGYPNQRQISDTRGFYDQGLDSLLALTFVEELNKRFTKKISAADLFSYSNLELLTAYLGTDKQENNDKKPVAETIKSESIAIIGMSCHFPGAETLNEFWDTLIHKKTVFTPIPNDRYFSDAIKTTGFKAGFIEHVFDFDANFFAIAANEALYLDPQQRLMLQTVQRALVDAGFEPGQQLPKKTAIIVGASGSDYGHLCLSNTVPMTPYSISGNSLNAIAGRVAYFLGVQGPAFAVDSACSSSLVAVTLAVDLLRNQQIEMAIVGGVNLLLSELSSLALQKTTVLSPDFKCLPFSDNANGMVRGEGCGVVVLMRESTAVAKDISAYSTIVASDSNQDGHSAELTAPNGQAQRELLNNVLEQGGINQEDVSYIEAHGTGTALGDPIELDAIAKAYALRNTPLYIGSLKGNIGHLEAAAGIASLIKASLMCHHHKLVPSITDGSLTRQFVWAESPIKISTAVENLPSYENPDLVLPKSSYLGVSAFGFSGTNAHVMLSTIKNSQLRSKKISQTISYDRQYFRLEPSKVSAAPPLLETSTNNQSPRNKVLTAIQHALLPGQDITTLEPNKPLESYGLGSLDFVDITGILAELFSTPLPYGFLYSYTTINSIVNYFENQKPSAKVVNTNKADYILGEGDIAIIGMSCRFGGNIQSLNDFWFCLKNGKSIITRNTRRGWRAKLMEIPTHNKFPHLSHMGLIEDYDYFDASLFGISPREAECMDPQHRLALETAWRALEDAGIYPLTEERTEGGIFVGSGTADFAHIASQSEIAKDPFIGTGSATSILAGRLAYHFNWCGPASVIDTACSSSLVAVHQACESLRSGECNLALAGGVNLILSPITSYILAQSQALSITGQCLPFSPEANGYVRAEGCAFLVLKSLQQAEREGDRIYAIIKGSAINQDGRSQGLTAPNGISQIAVMQQALRNAALNPEQVGFIETHGTGTPLGDPIEMESIKSVYAKNARKNPLFMGALKANIGHTESVAGVASLIKCALMLHRHTLPQEIVAPLAETSNQFATTTRQWESHAPRVAAVSSFGFSGTNVHLIIGEAPQKNILNSPVKHRVSFTRDHYPILGYDDAYAKYLQQPLNLPDNIQLYEMPFSANYPALFADHQLQGMIVIPGAFYLLMLLQALRQQTRHQFICLENIHFSSALIINSDDQCKLLWQIQKNEISLFSAKNSEELILRCKLYYRIIKTTTNRESKTFEFLQKIIEASEGEAPEIYYQFLQSQQVKLGPSFQKIKKYWVHQNSVISQIGQVDTQDIDAGFFDSILQTIGIYLRDHQTLGGVRVPISLKRITQYQHLSAPCYTVTLATDETNNTFDIDVFSVDGNLLLSIIEFKTVLIDEFQLNNRQIAYNTYGWCWQRDLNAQWSQQNALTKIIWRPEDRHDYQSKIFNASSKTLLIVDLTQTDDALPLAEFIRAIYYLCHHLATIQNYQHFQLQIISEATSDNLFKSILLGCLKTLSLECPDLYWYWHESEVTLSANTLEWWQPQALRDHVYLHAEDRSCYVQRFQRVPITLSQKFSLAENQCLVLVGGTSRIAQSLLPLLKAQGFNHIVSIQRQITKDAYTYQADILSQESLAQAFEQIELQHGKIGAVFHLIGSHAEGLFVTQTETSFASALLPKVQSAWNLHAILAKRTDIHLVLFSSAACVFGGMGQGSYAGANQYLHALALYRRKRALPTTVIAWGDWQSLQSHQHSEDIGLKPIAPEKALEILLSVMASSVDDQLVEAAFDMEWATLSNHPAKRFFSNEFSHFLFSAVDDTQERHPTFSMNELADKPFHQRKLIVENELRSALTTILNVPAKQFAVDKVLSTYGLESISSIELREVIFKRFAVNVPIAQLFNQLTLAALTTMILALCHLDETTAIQNDIQELSSLLEDE